MLDLQLQPHIGMSQRLPGEGDADRSISSIIYYIRNLWARSVSEMLDLACHHSRGWAWKSTFINKQHVVCFFLSVRYTQRWAKYCLCSQDAQNLIGQMDAGQASRITAQPAVEMLRGTKLQKRNINCSSEKSPAVHPFKSSKTLCPRVSTLTEGFLRKGEMAEFWRTGAFG